MSINLARITELASTVTLEETVEGYTAYGIAKVVNDTYAALGIDAEVRPQQVYNDSRSGRINGVKARPDQKVRYTEDEVEHYVAKLVAARTRKFTSAQAETDDEQVTGWEDEGGATEQETDEESNTETDES